MEASELSKATKRALTPIFNREHVSVTHGKGTAWSWIDARIRLPRPADCVARDEPMTTHWTARCPACAETRDLARRIAEKAIEEIPYSTYCSDDGYGTPEKKISSYFTVEG